jgi:uncharacterized protein YndB with AHSA1/START domain
MGSYHILLELDIDADTASVMRAIDTEDGIRAWWTTRTQLEDGAGGRRLLVSFPEAPQPFELDVRRSPNRVEWVTGDFPPPWAGTTMRLDLGPRPDAPGTRLLFGHRDWEPDNPVIPNVAMTWARILLRLKGYAETGTAQPYFDF